MKKENGNSFVAIFIVMILIAIAIIGIVYFINTRSNKNENNTTNEVIANKKVEDKKTVEDDDTLKVLVEKFSRFSGMPGPNGEGEYKDSIFLASDGYIYTFEYESRYDNDSPNYPSGNNLKELSEELIKVATKTNTKLTDEELELVKTYIDNIEEEKESINKSYNKIEPKVEDAYQVDRFSLYNYTSDEMMEINPKAEGNFYESPSITKLYELLTNYLK